MGLEDGGCGDLNIKCYVPRAPPNTKVCPATLDVLVTWTTNYGGPLETYDIVVSRAAARLLLVNELELFHPARKEERWRRLVSMLCLRPKNVQQEVPKKDVVSAISNNRRRASMYDTTDTERAISTLSSNAVKVPKKAKELKYRKMLATDLVEEISQFNAWVTRGKSDPKFGNPMEPLPRPIVNQWVNL